MDYLSPQIGPVIIRMGRVPLCECEDDMKNRHDEGSAANYLVRRDDSCLEMKRSAKKRHKKHCRFAAKAYFVCTTKPTNDFNHTTQTDNDQRRFSQ